MFKKKPKSPNTMDIKLMEDSITEEEIEAVKRCLHSGQYTQWDIVKDFEKRFAEWNGSKYGVMVNSGSSANLLMVDMLKHKYNLQPGDEVIVPSVTWPTTIYPIIQLGLVPVLCDVDQSFNLDISSMKRMLSNKTKAVFVVHLLGQSADMDAITKCCKENGLALIEDCCESLGAKHGDKKVGNFGEMGSFSFYFGHHMTTIEGGMITTDNFETYDLLRSTRSHGWVKRTSRENNYPDFPNNNFVFDIPGYNFRSTEINASIGLIQLKKLDGWIETRKRNHKYFLERIRGRFETQKVDIDRTSSFCLPLLFQEKKERDFVLKNLYAMKGVETRPVVAGNLLRQPVFRNKSIRADKMPMADRIHDFGIYLPNNQYMNKEKIDYMVNGVEELISS